MFKHPDTYEKYIRDYIIDWSVCPVCGTAGYKYRFEKTYLCRPCGHEWEEEEDD